MGQFAQLAVDHGADDRVVRVPLGQRLKKGAYRRAAGPAEDASVRQMQLDRGPGGCNLEYFIRGVQIRSNTGVADAVQCGLPCVGKSSRLRDATSVTAGSRVAASRMASDAVSPKNTARSVASV